MILKIKKSVNDSFDSDGGERINYYRIYGEKKDGVLIVFGSKMDHEDDINSEVDLMIEVRKDKNGKERFYEVL